jgi:pyridoxamine 5'-phosphate oxidase
MGHKDIFNLRKTYSKHRLDEQDLETDPIKQFQKWLEEALDAELDEPYAFTLSSVDENGHPDSRIVLLRQAEKRGFSFFTNYHSAKGQQIEQHPWVALNFFWAGLERQVRVKGSIEKLPEQESEAYFNSRPRESQIGAWASMLSQVLESRTALEDKVLALTQEMEGKIVVRPPHWGGYLVVPNHFEFWQGRPSRLHDRFAFSLLPGSEHWKIERLNP